MRGATPNQRDIDMRRHATLLLLLVSPPPAPAPVGGGFRSLSLFVGHQGESIAAQGEPPDSQCKRFGSCDVPGAWHSQSAQDRCVVQAIFEGRRDGYFVDLAANHPIMKLSLIHISEPTRPY